MVARLCWHTNIYTGEDGTFYAIPENVKQGFQNSCSLPPTNVIVLVAIQLTQYILLHQ